MKLEYQRHPTEQTQAHLEVKLQMLRRVEGQLVSMTQSDSQVAISVSVSEQVHQVYWYWRRVWL